LKAPTEAIAVELMLSDSPFLDAFGGALTVFRNEERFVFGDMLLFLRESLRDLARLVQQFEALPRLRSDIPPRFQLPTVFNVLRAAAAAAAPQAAVAAIGDARRLSAAARRLQVHPAVPLDAASDA
jgi:hypothetical protein